MSGKIEFIEKGNNEKEVKAVLHPLVSEWFFGKFENFSLTQIYGVKPIHDRKNILVSAPTGGTKTLTAFLSILNYLVELGLKNELEEKVYAVYCSPLKALSNDIFVNLISPLEEIKALAEKKNLKMQEIRVGLRTGDTTVYERSKMLKKTPHILVTTPETLAIVLTSGKFVEKFSMLEYLIVDEIHALTNKRAATERIVHYLENYYPVYAGQIGAHHSSMSKEKRFEIENKLRKGELKVVVSSTSLELGIDIGSVDFVVLLKSPKGSARALQRIGRAGHKLHDNPKGQFIVLDRDDLVECGVLMKEMVEKKIDRADIPRNALDVLAQQIYGMAISKIWNADEMLKTIRKSYCYMDLTKEDFFSVISYLAGDYALEHRHVYAKIWFNEATKEIGKKGKLARVIYMTNLGTIPSESFIKVVVKSPIERNGEVVGKIDEGFLERMKRGDVFVLGGQKYQFLYTRGMTASVKADISKNPTIPSWFSEMLPLSFDTALDIGKFRRFMKERIKKKSECVNFVREYLYCDKKIAEEIYNYFKEQGDFSQIPHEEEILVEKFKEEKEFLVFHSLYGRRVNDALSRAYGYAAARLQYRDVEVGISDNGFFIAGEKLDEKKIIEFVKSKDLKKILEEAIEKTDILKRRFRHCAARSLMILRNYKGREKSAGKQQVHSEFLYRAVMKISGEFPILREARREVMEELMDVENAKKVLEWIEKKEVKINVKRIPMVSPFALEMTLKGRADLIKMEDRAKFLKRMHQLHLKVIENK